MQKYSFEQLRTNSVKNPLAQYTKLLPPGTEPEVEMRAYIAKVQSLKILAPCVRSFLLILATSGLRISELCNISSSDVDSMLNIRIKGLKGSNDRIIQPVYMREQWQLFRSSSYTIKEIYSRFYFHRIMKNYGLYKQFQSSENNSVCHYPRYLYMKQLASNVSDIELLKNTIGHKRASNTAGYVEKL
jgi:site-specific recombinase XerD